jgi:hypothetical protein
MPDSPDQTQKTPSVTVPEHHPLDEIIGIFKDEPLWDDLMEEIRKGRERASRVSSQPKTRSSPKRVPTKT